MQKDNLWMTWWWFKQERCWQVYVQSPRPNHNKKYVRVIAILRNTVLMQQKNQSCKQLLRHILWWSTQWWWISKKQVGYNFNSYDHYINCSYGNAWYWIFEDIKQKYQIARLPSAPAVSWFFQSRRYTHTFPLHWVERGEGPRLGETVIWTSVDFPAKQTSLWGQQLAEPTLPQFKHLEIHDVRSIAKRKGCFAASLNTAFFPKPLVETSGSFFVYVWKSVSVFVCVCVLWGWGRCGVVCCYSGKCIFGCFHKLCPLSAAETGIKKTRVVWFPV